MGDDQKGAAPEQGDTGGGSYTARPSEEPPAERPTRDEDQEKKVRTGSDTRDGSGRGTPDSAP